MTKLKLRWVLWCAVIGAFAGWIAPRVLTAAGRYAPVLDYSALYSLGAVCAVILFLGIRVKRSSMGKSHFEPIAAARTLVLAQASAYAGAVITGWHVPAMITLWLANGQSPTLTRSLVLAGAGVLMVIVGYIVQHLCKLPPEDTDDTNDSVVTE
ncbi:DUF3180 domain-containing protein [Glutamicibacter halophytocola]|uniref:DUF3180 domain-containing protein n=1 Tax=Glutamicibacter halophytocola TaxID=1933880 RepID=UPI00321A781B